MKHTKSRSTIIEFPVFSDYFIHVEVSSDLKKLFERYIKDKENGWDDVDARADGCTIDRSEYNMTFIFLKSTASVGTIAHECYHAVCNMFKHIGTDMDEEMVAYHIGFLVDEIFKLLRYRK